MLSRTLIATVTACALLAPLVAAQTSPCTVPAVAANVERMIIDARAGRVVSGKKRYPRTAVVEVVITHKNPFLFAYAVETEEVTLAEAGLTAFLPFVAPFNLEAAPATPETPAAQPAAGSGADISGGARTRRPACPLLNALRTRHADLQSDRENVDALFRTAETDIKNTSAAFASAKATLEHAHASCDSLFNTATVVVATLRSFSQRVDLDAVSKAVDALEEKAEAQTAALRAYRTTRDPGRPCRPREGEIDAISDRAELISDVVVDKMRANLAKLQTAKQTLEAGRQSIQTVLDAGPTAFTGFLLIGPFDEATTVTVKLDRKELKPNAQFATFAQRDIAFGGPAFFTLAGGLAGSTVDRVQYERVQGFALDPTTGMRGTELTNIIAEKENSSSRVTPLLMLHGRLWDAHAMVPVTVQASLGVSAKVDNLGVDVEYLVGPTFGFLDSKLFLTVGAYGGRVQQLEGGLQPGMAVPEELTEIPVRKDLVWRLGFAITYKMQ